jgi:hypothetical protein
MRGLPAAAVVVLKCRLLFGGGAPRLNSILRADFGVSRGPIREADQTP